MVFLIVTKLCINHHYLIPEYLQPHPPVQKTSLLAVTPLSLLSELLAIINLVSVSTDLPSLEIAINWIIQYVPYCDRLLSLRIMSSTFIHVVACISISLFFLRLNNILL